MQTGPFAVGTRVRIQGSSNDPMAIGGKVGRIATLIPGGAMVKLDDREEKVNVREASMTLEKGVNAEIVDADGVEWVSLRTHVSGDPRLPRMSKFIQMPK